MISSSLSFWAAVTANGYFNVFTCNVQRLSRRDKEFLFSFNFQPQSSLNRSRACKIPKKIGSESMQSVFICASKTNLHNDVNKNTIYCQRWSEFSWSLDWPNFYAAIQIPVVKLMLAFKVERQNTKSRNNRFGSFADDPCGWWTINLY